MKGLARLLKEVVGKKKGKDGEAETMTSDSESETDEEDFHRLMSKVWKSLACVYWGL